MAIKHSIWTITAKTNLHVGNESSANFGIIDKAVQRDPITSLPCINASSLKGALNEHFSKMTDNYFEVFGSDKKEGQKASTKGLCSFFDAALVAIPEQCDSAELFELCSTSNVLADFNNKVKLFGIEGIRIQDYVRHPLNREKRIVLKENDFCGLYDDFGLPVIARNRVGEQRNLWYEQVIPRETVFATMISYPEENDCCKTFIEKLDNTVVQIGANATIGYGYCLFKRINP